MKSGKVSYLKFFNKKTKKKYVPNFIYFSKKNFIHDSNKYLNLIKNKFKKKIIIRSSAIDEDTKNFSNAGKYSSYANIDPNNNNDVSLSINKILKKFKNMNDQVIIQEFLVKPDISGVIFTYDTNNNAPYYIINYDYSKKSDLITSGAKNDTMQTLYIYRDKFEIKNEIFNRLIKIVKKIEKIFLNNKLDIEFSIKKKDVYIFQIRPLAKITGSTDYKITTFLNNISKKIKKLKSNIPDIFGEETIFSNMSDWNPAEIIGDKPKPLSISLYSELITNSVWAEQRSNYGYQDVRPNKLMMNLGGSPFIDLRTDLNSFLPKNLKSKIKNKIVKNCINFLKKKPFFHDKLEFDVIPTCFNLTIDDEIKKLIKQRSDALIYKKALKKLTINILNKNFLPYKFDKNQISKINSIIKKIKQSKLSPIQKIYFLVYYCKIYGTLPFAGIARVAFICTNILISLLKKEYISKQDYNYFYSNLNTITKQISSSYNKLIGNKISKKKFINKYGHIRPSSYSISSLNYKEGFNLYFSTIKNKINNIDKINDFKLDRAKVNSLNKILTQNLNINAKSFFKLAKESIEKREYAKFKFMIFVNEIFNNILIIAKEIKIERNDLEYIDINNFLDAYSNLNIQRLEKILRKNIANNKANYKLTAKIKFPDVIINHDDCYQFLQTVNNGNYISNKKVVLKVIKYDPKVHNNNYKNKIVLIENADPGYDFLFNFRIGGLITKYGGANSHMSIRCLELDIPAIIGIGDVNFNKLLKSNTVEMICIEKKFRIIN